MAEAPIPDAARMAEIEDVYRRLGLSSSPLANFDLQPFTPSTIIVTPLLSNNSLFD